MANLPQQDTITQSLGDGISTDFIVPFYTPIDADGTPNIDVYVQAPTAAPIPQDDLQEWNVAYIYTPYPNEISGGIVTFLPFHIPAVGYVVTIVRNVSASLNVEFADAQNFSGITLDNALDKLLLITQQNKSYAFDRNISYIVNSYIPSSTMMANVQIPVLQSNQIWIGSAGGVIAATLEQNPDVSTLRSQLANNSLGTDGAKLVGYYDTVNSSATTVDLQLTYLTSNVVAAYPTGALLDFAGTSPPAGFLVCDGSSVLRATYATLFSVIGTTWGSVDGSHFNLPDLQHRVTMGSGGTTANPTIGTAVGNVGGEDLHTQAADEVGPHVHSATSASSSFRGTNSRDNSATVPYLSSPSGGGNTFHVSLADYSISTTIDLNTPAGTPFNIIQKSAVVLKCIKY